MAPFLFSILLVLTSFQDDQASLPKGTFVSMDDRVACIEFTDDGRFYLSDEPFGFETGRFMKAGSSLICKRSQGDLEFEFLHGKLTSKSGARWRPRESVIESPEPNPSNVTIVVLDSETRIPVKEFEYSYVIESNQSIYNPFLARPVHVSSADGSFSLSAPEACEIHIGLAGQSLVGSHDTPETLKLTSRNQQRRLEVLVERGVSVSGVVVDSESGNPVAQATVSPLVFAAPILVPADNRSVKTDLNGKFEIHGIDPSLGFYITHDAYLDDGWHQSESDRESVIRNVRVELSRGETILGTVHDANGKPLNDVTVSDQRGKSTTTNAAGDFTLLSPSKSGSTYVLTFEKNGYLQNELNIPSGKLDQARASLTPLPQLSINLSSNSSGDLTDSVQLAAGPGREPEPWACTAKNVSGQGPFPLAVRTDWDFDNQQQVWVGIRTNHHAFWETVVPAWEGTKTLEARLVKGVSVQGTVTSRSKRLGVIEAHLLPTRLSSGDYSSATSQRQEMGRAKVSVADTGKFHFTNIATGTYLLAVSGRDISPVSQTIQVADQNLDVGTLELKGTGSIAGVVNQNPRFRSGTEQDDDNLGVQPFAAGEIHFSDSAGNSNEREFSHLAPILFKTDDRGRFRVENVPVGIVSVRLPYMATADIIDSDTLDVKVVEGKTTPLEFFRTDRRENVRCQIVVGDGSKNDWLTGTGLNASRKVSNVNDRRPSFRIDLEPISGIPSAFPAGDWRRLNASREIGLHDVAPGRYELVVGDWLGSRGFRGEIFRTEIEVGDQPIQVKIPLGSGCVTGSIDWQKDNQYMIHVIATGKQRGTVRHARCDRDGNFCLRYLPKDVYQIIAHDPRAGWCSFPDVTVDNNVHDLATQSLQDGGTIRVTLPMAMSNDKNISLMARHEWGMTVDALSSEEARTSGKTQRSGREFSQLWPGKWTVSVHRGDSRTATKQVEVNENATIEVRLEQ